jgi:hypothetical protein
MTNSKPNFSVESLEDIFKSLDNISLVHGMDMNIINEAKESLKDLILEKEQNEKAN